MELIFILLREFRYIFKSKKLKKYLTILFFCIIFLCFLSIWNNCKATFDFTCDNQDFSLPDLPAEVTENTHFIICQYKYNNKYILYFTNSDDFGQFVATNKYNILDSSGSNCSSRRYAECYLGDSQWSSPKNWADLSPLSYNKVIYATDNVYNSDGSVYFSANVPEPPKIAPFIRNESGEIENWNFQEFLVDSGGYTTLDDIYIKFHYSRDNSTWYDAETFHLNYESDYVVLDDPFGYYVAHIPITDIFKHFTLRQGDYVGFEISYGEETDYYGGYQLLLSGEQTTDNENAKTQAELEKQTTAINNQTSKIEEQTNAINGTTQAVNDTNDFLKNNTVDDSQFTLPTVEVSDPTANFFDTMFMGLYNAVTNNEDQTISFTILGNNISISSADFDYLNSNEWNVLRIILSSMWVFGIGIYVLKDIRKMIDKIKDGNVENMATDDIKANMV